MMILSVLIRLNSCDDGLLYEGDKKHSVIVGSSVRVVGMIRIEFSFF